MKLSAKENICCEVQVFLVEQFFQWNIFQRKFISDICFVPLNP